MEEKHSAEFIFLFSVAKKEEKSSLINSFASSETEKNARSFIPFFQIFFAWMVYMALLLRVGIYVRRKARNLRREKKGKLCKVQKVITIPLHLSRVVLRRCLLYFLWYLSYIFS